MAGPFYVDDGGNGSDGLSWANAETSINDLDAAVALAAGEVVYFGHDHACQAVNGANLTIAGPTSGLPVKFLSVTQGSSPETYAAGIANQVDTTEGAYSITFDGSFAVHGLMIASGSNIAFSTDIDESFLWKAGTIKLGAAGTLNLTAPSSTSQSRLEVIGATISCAADGATPRSASVCSTAVSKSVLSDITFTNVDYRTGSVFDIATNNGTLEITGCDFSGFTNATACELFSATSSAGFIQISNCLTAATWAMRASGSFSSGGRLLATNVGPADEPTYLYYQDYFGTCISSSSIYRTSGATIEGDATSWLITTSANCSEGSPFYTPWIYGTVNSTGAKTFDLYITNDTADFTDAQVWLEVEYLKDADEAQWTLATDQRATITTTAAPQDDDATSAWVGSQANMLDYSEQFDNATWTKTRSNVTANAATDPLGGNTADKFYDDGTVTNTHLIATGGTDLNVATYTFSVYAKAAERSWIRLMNGSIGATQAAYFDLTNGVTGTVGGSCTAAITSVGSGWYRCSITFAIASFGSNGLQILLATGDNGQSYSGDSASGVYIWGAQCELAGAVSAYSATTNNNFTADYTQKLSVTATIGETGQYRARVAVGVASIASSRYFYVDPLITVS